VLGFVIFAMVDCTFMTNHLLYTAEPANDTGSEFCNVFTQEKTTIEFWWFINNYFSFAGYLFSRSSSESLLNSFKDPNPQQINFN